MPSWLRRAVGDPRIVALSLVAVATLVSQVPAFPGSRPAGSTSRDPGASSAGGARSSDPVPSASGDPAATSPEPPTTSAGAPSGSAAGSGPPATPIPNGSLPPGPAASAIFPGGLLIADRGNGRLLVVNDAGRLLWSFPGPGSLPHGQQFSADDAFVAPDGRTIVANDEAHQVIDRIDIASRRVIWQYGHYSRAGAGAGFLHTPDDAYPLANGDIVVADIRNCRIMQIAPTKQVVRQWGRTGQCLHHPPQTFAQPNGDTPLPDGGLLITEITGSRIVRLDARGRVVFDIRARVTYPSDAQLDAAGNIIVVDYADPGAVLRISPRGRVLWRYGPRAGPGRLNHPSLALPLPNGMIVLNDDDRQRIVVIDPRTNRIVWQYGRTDRPSRAAGHLFIPDGIDLVPVGIFVPAAG